MKKFLKYSPVIYFLVGFFSAHILMGKGFTFFETMPILMLLGAFMAVAECLLIYVLTNSKTSSS